MPAGQTSKARRAAWDVLGAYLVSDPGRARIGTRRRPFPAPDLEPRDRALAKELAEGVVRRLRTLDAILADLRPGKALRPVGLRAALLLGAYQLLFHRSTPAHTAVHESVELAKLAAKEGGGRLANALLRRIADRPDLSAWVPPPSDTASAAELGRYFSFPDELAARWVGRHGPVVGRALFEAANAEPWLTLRTNVLRITPEELAERLGAEGVHTRPGPHPKSLLVDRSDGSRALLDAESFQNGCFSVQDATQTEVVDTLDLRPGHRVLDLCAAPGGKATAMAEAMQDQGLVLATDREPDRLARLPSELTRLGLTCVKTETDRTRVAAAAPFDRVLVDAPCSNTGVLGRRPEARWRFGADALQRHVEVQRQLLLDAAKLVGPGGRLVYATCSIEPEENEELARSVAEHAEAGLRLLSAERVLPEQGLRDGGGVAVFRKESEG